MKTLTSLLLLTLLVANLVAADQQTLRYQLAGEMQLSMEQDIYPGGRTEPLAGREFTMTFVFADAPSDGEFLAELTAIKGSYNAHGMNQRLSTWPANRSSWKPTVAPSVSGSLAEILTSAPSPMVVCTRPGYWSMCCLRCLKDRCRPA
jgi:hypothetical protein